MYSYAELNNRQTAEKTQGEPRAQEVSKNSTNRSELDPDPGRKSSQDLSIDKCSSVESLDSDVAIIDVGSPSCEQYRAVDRTPNTENKKRGLDTTLVQSDSKVHIGTSKICTVEPL